MAEMFRQREGAEAAELRRRHAAQFAAERPRVPRLAPRVGDDREVGAAERVRDQFEAPIGEDRARGDDTPGAQRHRGRADAEHGAGTFTEDERPGARQ